MHLVSWNDDKNEGVYELMGNKKYYSRPTHLCMLKFGDFLSLSVFTFVKISFLWDFLSYCKK